VFPRKPPRETLQQADPARTRPPAAHRRLPAAPSPDGLVQPSAGLRTEAEPGACRWPTGTGPPAHSARPGSRPWFHRAGRSRKASLPPPPHAPSVRQIPRGAQSDSVPRKPIRAGHRGRCMAVRPAPRKARRSLPGWGKAPACPGAGPPAMARAERRTGRQRPRACAGPRTLGKRTAGGSNA